MVELLEAPPVKQAPSSFFNRRYEGEERAELAAQYGQIPFKEAFIPSLSVVLSWGNPVWQVYEEVYIRNEKLANSKVVSEEDNLRVWQALHVLLARRVLSMIVPSFLGNDATRYRWRDEFMMSASSWMWEIICSCSDKPLSPANAIHFTMLKAQTWIITHQTKDAKSTTYLSDAVTEMASRRAGRLVSVFDEVANRIDNKTTEDRLDVMVVNALTCRFPPALFPGIAAAAEKVVAGGKAAAKYKWLLDFATVYRRYFRNALRDQERKQAAI